MTKTGLIGANIEAVDELLPKIHKLLPQGYLHIRHRIKFLVSTHANNIPHQQPVCIWELFVGMFLANLLFSHLGKRRFPDHNLVDTTAQGKDLSFRVIQRFPLPPPKGQLVA